MITLRSTLGQRGRRYSSSFGDRAEDIYFDSTLELCEAIGYILGNINRIDAEIPESQYVELRRIFPNYPISNGLTSGGNTMKWAPQYRIYFSETDTMPFKLQQRLQNDTQMRITGSLFIESCFFIGFAPGVQQDRRRIIEAINELFEDDDERRAFDDGFNL